jgi:2-polyprenyl-3-methyl-5-hydroxy-6-metoxy-1,4-benzoquinol methylase
VLLSFWPYRAKWYSYSVLTANASEPHKLACSRQFTKGGISMKSNNPIVETKGNHVENWDDSYRNLHITYDEGLVSPPNIANYVGFTFVYEDLMKFLPGIVNAKVVEVGCGGARASLFLAMRGCEVTCVDNSPEAIRLAKDNFSSRNAHGTFVLDDLLNSSLPEGSFDCVMSFGLLEHFRDINVPIKAITKLLRPGGIHIHNIIPKKFSSETMMRALYFPLLFLKNAFRNRSFRGIVEKSFRDFPHYENSFSAREYAETFTKEGCEVLRCEAEGLFYPLVNLPRGLGNIICRKYPKIVVKLFRATDRSQSRLMHLVSPTFYIVSRKK